MRQIQPGSTAFVLLIAGLMTMSAMTIDINLPAIPATALDLEAPTSLVQLTVTIFFVGFAIGQAVYGSSSDRFGRKPVLVLGTALFIASSLACAVAQSAEMLLAMRLVQGLGAGAGPVLGRAIIRDLFHGAQMARVMSFAMAAFITAPIIAPTIGAAILALASWRWIFVFLAAYGVLILILAVSLVPETLTRLDPHALRPSRIAGAWAAVLRDRDARVFGTIGTLALSALVVYLANASALFMSTYGLTANQFGVVFAGVALCAAIGNLTNARLVRHVPMRRLIAAGTAISAVALAASLGLWLASVAGFWVLLPGFAGFFFAFGFMVSNSTTLALAPHGHIVGAASSVLGVAQAAVPAVIASLSAAAYDGTALPTLAIMLGLVVLAGFVFLWARPRAVRE